MAQVTFTIPNSKIQYFIDCFGEQYAEEVANGNIDGSVVSQADFAKIQAFQFLSNRVRKWKRYQDEKSIADIDITK